jgi:hypothetical protein
MDKQQSNHYEDPWFLNVFCCMKNDQNAQKYQQNVKPDPGQILKFEK